MSSDIENPPLNPAAASTSSAAGDASGNAAPEPSRHGFWAFKERFVALCFSGNNPQHQDDHDEVATADADHCSRFIFVNFWSSFFFLLIVGFIGLLGFAFGSAGPVALRVLAIVGIVVAFCCLGFFIDLGDGLDKGRVSAHRVIDFLM